MKHHALQLYDYHVWANKKFFERIKELPQGIYEQEIQSVFPSIAETLAHMYVTDIIWLGVIREDSMDGIFASLNEAKERAEGKSIEEMEAMFAELSDRYKTFLNNQEDLDKPMVPEHPTFGRLETQLSELIQHIVNHGTYHRGNITAMIRQLGHSSVPNDYVFYLYDQDTEN
ncbi:MAG TPA: DinB family protein [Bacillales bacterium]|nr:DinB family protein [Bacillales bacterium]